MLATGPVLLLLVVTISNLQIIFLSAMGTIQLNQVLYECQISLLVTVHEYVHKFKRYLCRLKTFKQDYFVFRTKFFLFIKTTQLGASVEDGTPCGADTFDTCVNGQCIPAGCDHVLGSGKTLGKKTGLHKIFVSKVIEQSFLCVSITEGSHPTLHAIAPIPKL